MSLHQVIYTSCMRGINGVNDGQQIFSYDASFKDVNNDGIKSLFTYQPPELQDGLVMTEEIALTLPKSFIYRRLDDDICSLSLSTYLGRDYMGSAGRFGNHLSHVILADKNEIVNYPCEFFASDMLRDHMEFEEVNNPEPPDFLPVPVLEKGAYVDIDSVVDFLNIGDRIEVLKNMIYAVLTFERTRKRVVICDTPENIIMWIAAIEYTLPLRTALKINFTTYEYNPSLSRSQICGVIPRGSKFDENNTNLHYVFNLYKNSCPEFDKDETYFDFISTVMAFSYDSMEDFHNFITSGYTYEDADENMYSAYYLYSLLSDGFTGLGMDKINSALSFAEKFALPQEKIRIVNSILDKKDILMQEDLDVFMCINKFLVSNYRSLSAEDKINVKSLIINRIFCLLSNAQTEENVFLSFYNSMDSVCSSCGFRLSCEIMKDNNIAKLYDIMKKDLSQWKISFIVKLVSSFMKQRNLSVDDIAIDSPYGKIIYNLLKCVYTANKANVFFFICRWLDEFSNDCVLLVNMTFNIEGMLLDIPNENQNIESLWKYFNQVLLDKQRNNFSTVYSILLQYQRYDQIYSLYKAESKAAINIEELEHCFDRHYKNFILADKEYSNKYADEILLNYYNNISSSDYTAVCNAKMDLFNKIYFDNRTVSFARNLVDDIVAFIPFASPTIKNQEFLQNAFEYLYNVLHIDLEGKLLLLVIGTVLEKTTNKQELHSNLNKLYILTSRGRGNLIAATESGAKKYLDWIIPQCCSLCSERKELECIYKLFDMTEDKKCMFFNGLAICYLQEVKNEKKYNNFCEFLSLLFSEGNDEEKEEVGKLVHKLGRQKLSNLDFEVSKFFHSDKHALECWEKMKETESAAHNILNNFSNIFKKKND